VCLLVDVEYVDLIVVLVVVIKVDKQTPKEANRNVFEMPERPFQEEDEAALAAGLRRRRTMREVQDIIGTQDGLHVMILCADGGVMYYRRALDVMLPKAVVSSEVAHDCQPSVSVPMSPTVPRSDLIGDFSASPYVPFPAISNIADNEQVSTPNRENSRPSSPSIADTSDRNEDLGFLQELTGIQREQEIDQAWTLKRVGSAGHVVLLRAAQVKSKDGNSVGVVSVSLLQRKFVVPFNFFYLSCLISLFSPKSTSNTRCHQ
jgi:hypothetical protein